MAIKILKWYGVLIWNFYAIATKIMIWMALRAANKVWSLIT
jgi:hypothetical protein